MQVLFPVFHNNLSGLTKTVTCVIMSNSTRNQYDQRRDVGNESKFGN